MIVALAGGVGAARLLRGMVEVVDPAELTVVVNTGDDVVLHGLHISPDLDTVTYTLADAINTDTGWGLDGETWEAMGALSRYSDDRVWFNLGDRDLGTHLYRTARLAEGATLSEVTSEIARRWSLGLRLLPMSDDRVETRVTVPAEDAATWREIGFQEYFVGLRHEVPVREVRFEGAKSARPAPGVSEAMADAEGIVICPSNPIVSIGPLLAVPGIADLLTNRRAQVVAISPIVAGRALKGPADHLMSELGHEPSVVGVARIYAGVAGTLVVDHADAALARAVEAEGIRCVVAPTIMTGLTQSTALSRTVLELIIGHGR